jgi:predicted flap endonuclease-1-like 5' DNA nuclease
MNWNWLSFLVGVLLGWLVEWLIDFFFWRRKLRASQETTPRLQTQLDSKQARCSELEALVTSLRASLRAKEDELSVTADQRAGAQAEVQNLRERLATQETLVADCEKALRARESELAALSEGLSSPESPLEAGRAVYGDSAVRVQALHVQGTEAKAAAPVAVEPDDLRVIEGIGPKIADILNSSGILTFAQLADTPVSTLQGILRDAGSRFRIANPTSWPQQARLAAEEKWDELKELQDRLTAGRVSPGPGPVQ